MALLITNNDKARRFFEDQSQEMEIIYLAEGGYMDVLRRARDRVHTGYCLLSHPLCGSVKPNQTPYRSVILAEGGTGDEYFRSVELIESSIEAAEKFLRNKSTPAWNDRTREDFKTVDLSFLRIYAEGRRGETGGVTFETGIR